jgi:hypothetical protein
MSVAKGVAALTAWIDQKGDSGNVIWTFSESTVSAIQYLNAHPEDRNTWYLLGSPSTPGNYQKTASAWVVLNTHEADITFIVRQYDSVADYPQGTLYKAQSNVSLKVHTKGYDGIVVANPDKSVDLPNGARILYYLTYPLPSISVWFKSQATIAKDDAAMRPRIESQYYVAGKQNRPVVLPEPNRQWW